MEASVYVDLYFLVNFSMDLLCLMITARLMHRRASRWRVLAASAMGGVYAVAALLLGFSGMGGLISDILAAYLLCLIAFTEGKRRALSALRCCPVLFLTSMLIGGVMTALYTLLNRLQLPIESLQGDGLSVWLFVLLAAISGVATLRGGSFLGLSRKTERVEVSAVLFGKSVTLTAMVDTGNLLRDPLSDRRVIVVELERLVDFLPPTLAKACRTGHVADWLAIPENAGLARLIPMQTASGTGMLLGLIPERLTLKVGKDRYPADYLIAPTPLGTLTGDFDAMIPAD